MMCGNAAGQLLPVYTVYKSEKMWASWVENGPIQARYNRTKSGWFDFQCFEDWFNALLLPFLKKIEGKKVIIGDNLRSNINLEVIKNCNEHNIAFVCLPANSTHLLQPLDVAFFRPMKIAWRQVLNTWKEKTRNSRCTAVPKEEFPALLKELMNIIEEKSAENLKSGFKKCGIFPFDPQPVMKSLPKQMLEDVPAVKELIGKSFLENLNEKRQAITSVRTTRKRKMLDVPAGKSISADDFIQDVPHKQKEKKTKTVSNKGKKIELFQDPRASHSLPSTSSQNSTANDPLPNTSSLDLTANHPLPSTSSHDPTAHPSKSRSRDIKSSSPVKKKITILQQKIFLTCKTCKRLGEKESGITCSTCKDFYHLRCISKNHKDHLPDQEDCDLFICHRCFKTIDDSDSYDSDELYDLVYKNSQRKHCY